MANIDNFYDKAFGKESVLFVGTLWLGMIAKHMDEVRKAGDEAYENHGDFILKWVNKLRTLYDNVEFKTDIPRYPEKKVYDLEIIYLDKKTKKYTKDIFEIPLKELFITWFDKLELMWEIYNRLGEGDQNKIIRLKKGREILKELGNCQRALYREIEKKHLIMPPEKEDMKELAKKDWHDRSKSKNIFD